MERKEGKEIKEVKEVKEKSARVAAFFDLDGTLLPVPSLERRFFRALRYRNQIPLKTYFLWLAEAVRLLPRGFGAIVHANKMYLKGVKTLDESGEENSEDSFAHESGQPTPHGASQGEGQASGTPPKRERRNPRWPVPRFFDEAVERVAWHAHQGHVIVIVSGTLEPLAAITAQALEAEVAARGIATKIRVCATQLEEAGGRWTGRIIGDAMFGAAKARAAEKLAEEMRLNLAQCLAYGDSANDRWLLSVVGKPVAVNPSPGLARIAKTRSWLVLRWNEEKELTQRTQSSQRAQRSQRKGRRSNHASLEKSMLRQAEICR